MAQITSIDQIDLVPIPGKTYFNCNREWREEFIYFLLVDRFHDDTNRAPVLQPGRSLGIQAGGNFYGTEVLVAYNVSGQNRNDAVIVDGALHKTGDTMSFLYGKQGTADVETAPNGSRFVRLNLAGNQFVILK